MKPSEILGSLPKWKSASPDELVASPAWAMPCRLGETVCTMRLDAIRPADTLDVDIRLEDDPHVLSLTDSPRFENLHSLWASRADVPEPIMLALVEKECGQLLQLVENAARRQLKIVGLSAPDEHAGERLCARICADGEELLTFAITSSRSLVAAFGKLAFIDATHPSVRDETLPAETEIASFVLSAADVSSLAVGDALLMPEVGSVPPRLVVDGRFLVDQNGVASYVDDGRFRVLDADARTVTLGALFDQAQTPTPGATTEPTQLRLVASDKEIARGHLGRIASHPAFMVEALSSARPL